jgi:lipoyl(octanoyl) transferase
VEQTLWVARLGTVPYTEALAFQNGLRERRQRDEVPDTLLLLDHPPVFTKGRRSEASELPMGDDWYELQGIEVLDTPRGGRVTYHGPGQLVGYPVMRIGDVVAYLRTMESALIAALGDFGVEARTRDGLTGVWVEDRKIASIGVHVSRGVTAHGFAVNVENDLQPFEWAVPCGIENVQMTSLLSELDAIESLFDAFADAVVARFAEAHGLTVQAHRFPVAGGAAHP